MVEIGQVNFKGEKNVFRARAGGARKTINNSPFLFPFCENFSGKPKVARTACPPKSRAKRAMKAGADAMRVPRSGTSNSGGNDGNSFSPLTPFSCRRRSFQSSVIFGKISSSDFVDWLQPLSLYGKKLHLLENCNIVLQIKSFFF